MVTLLPLACPSCGQKPPGPSARRLPGRCPRCGRWLRLPDRSQTRPLDPALPLTAPLLPTRPDRDTWLLPTRHGPVRLDLRGGPPQTLPAPEGLAAAGLARLPDGSLLVTPQPALGRARPWRIGPHGDFILLPHLPEAASWSPPLVKGERVWLLNDRGDLVALQGPDMRVRWRRSFPPVQGSPPRPVLVRGLLVLVTGRGVVGLDPATGGLRWAREIGSDRLRAETPLEPDAEEAVVYVALNGRLYRIEALTGRVAYLRAPRVSASTGRGFFGRLRRTRQGLLVVHTAPAGPLQYVLRCLDPETAAVRWEYAIRGWHPYPPVAVLEAAETDWVLLPHRGYRALVVLDGRDGREVGRLALPEQPVTEPVVHQDRVYVFYGVLHTDRPLKARGLAVFTATLTPETLPDAPAHLLLEQGRPAEAALKWAWEGYPWLAAWVYRDMGHPEAARWADPTGLPPSRENLVLWWERALQERDWETFAEVVRRRLNLEPHAVLQALEAALGRLPVKQALRKRLAALLEGVPAWPTWEDEQKARDLAARLLFRPQLRILNVGAMVLRAGQAQTVRVAVRNAGHGPAYGVRLEVRPAHGRARVLDPQPVTLAPGERRSWRVRLEPEAPGELALALRLTYRDRWGAERADEGRHAFPVRGEGPRGPKKAASLPDLAAALVGLALTLTGKAELATWGSEATKALLKALLSWANARGMQPVSPRAAVSPDEVRALLNEMVAALPAETRARLAAGESVPAEDLVAALERALADRPAWRRRIAALVRD